MENTINWSVFSKDEKTSIEKLLEMRMPEHLTSVILNMDKDKELEIQKIISGVRPINSLEENILRENIITEYYKKNPRGPQTPAEEKVLQDELDFEMTKFQEEKKKQAFNQTEALKTKEKTTSKVDKVEKKPQI